MNNQVPNSPPNRSNKVNEYKNAMRSNTDRQKEYQESLRHAREQIKTRVEEEGRSMDDESEKPSPAPYMNRITDTISNKFGSNFLTFYDSNLCGFNNYKEGAKASQMYNLDHVKASALLHTQAEDSDDYSNVMFEAIFNYKVDGRLTEINSLNSTVFFLPVRLRLTQRKIRLNALQAELQKLVKADPIIKEIAFIGNEFKSKTIRIDQPDEEDSFLEYFKIDVLSEVGSNSVVISKKNVDQSIQLPDHYTLICPDVTSF